MRRNLKIWTKLPIILLIFFLSIILAFFILHILQWQKDSNAIEIQAEQLNKLVDIFEVDSSNATLVNPPEDKKDPYWDYVRMNLISVDFAQLLRQNSDTKAWIQVEGTNINYPVVQASDNDFYLTRAYDKSYNQAGWVFLDYRNNLKSLDRNTVIYAHGRLNGTMFGSLKNILTNDWLKNSENYIIKLSSQDKNTLWQVFSVYRIKTTNDYIEVNFSGAKAYTAFLDKLKLRSAHNFATSLNSQDKIITLSTCYNSAEKVVMHAKLIKETLR